MLSQRDFLVALVHDFPHLVFRAVDGSEHCNTIARKRSSILSESVPGTQGTVKLRAADGFAAICATQAYSAELAAEAARLQVEAWELRARMRELLDHIHPDNGISQGRSRI